MEGSQGSGRAPSPTLQIYVDCGVCVCEVCVRRTMCCDLLLDALVLFLSTERDDFRNISVSSSGFPLTHKLSACLFFPSTHYRFIVCDDGLKVMYKLYFRVFLKAELQFTFPDINSEWWMNRPNSSASVRMGLAKGDEETGRLQRPRWPSAWD